MGVVPLYWPTVHPFHVAVQPAPNPAEQTTPVVVLAMILQFLRLFPHFRALEADRDSQVVLLREELQQMTTDKLVLQDRLDAAEQSVSRLWGMVEDAHNRAYDALKMQVNFATQQRFGITPYPEANHLPASVEPDLDADRVLKRRPIPSELMAQSTSRLVNDLVKEMTGRKSA